MLARARAPVTMADARRIRERLGRATVVVADAATITLAGRRVSAIGVDPRAFAPFTPGVTARSRPLWQRVAAGDVAVAFPVARAARLPLGGVVPGGAPPRHLVPVRVGALAAFGLPGVDAVTSPATAQRLGMAPRRFVLVSASGHDPAAVGRVLRDVLGPAVRVDALHTAKPSAAVLRAGWSGTWRDLYQRAAPTCPGLPWQVLAAIGTIESGNGRDIGPSTAGALGPMQFLPSTWASYGVDADGDGSASIMDPVDAVYSAARYLCDNGAGRGPAALAGAIYAYNHASWYVSDVLALAARIG